MIRRSTLGWLAVMVVALLFAAYVAKRPMDFRVYHYGARGVFDGTRPVYGRTSGLGWPMHYRYPPLFLLLFAPFALLPLGISAGIWLLLKFAVLILLLRLISKKWQPTGWVAAALLAGPYVVQDFRYGNVQFFVFALTAVGLMLADTNPLSAAGALGLGIAIKVWPLFFIPYLVARRYTKVAACSLLFTILLTLLPAVHFGIRANFDLLRQWFQQEYSTQAGQEEIWFPSQSLRGVLMRYLTTIDYSQVPDSHYTNINFADLNRNTVRMIWAVLAGAIYLGFLWLARSQTTDQHALTDALGFCLVALLEPFTQKYALVILLIPAIVIAREMKTAPIKALVYLGITLIILQPLMPGSSAQRMVQVLGLDFAATSTLAVALTSLLVGRTKKVVGGVSGDDEDVRETSLSRQAFHS